MAGWFFGHKDVKVREIQTKTQSHVGWNTRTLWNAHSTQRHRNTEGRIEQRCPLRGFKGACPLFGVRYGPKSKCRLRFCRTAFTQIRITTSERTNVHFPQLCEKAVRQNRDLHLCVEPYHTPAISRQYSYRHWLPLLDNR